MLSLSAPTCVSISPAKSNLSICSQFPSEIVPGLINEDEQTISTYIDGFRHETVFICKLCNSDHFRSTPSIKKHQREVHKIIVRPILNYPFEPTLNVCPNFPVGTSRFQGSLDKITSSFCGCLEIFIVKCQN